VCPPVPLVPDPSRDGRRLRILLTNTALEHRGGSELYLLDVARWLRDRGHAPVLYSARLGPLAETIRQQALPVIDDLARLADPPDVIHAQHHLPAMAALARFPQTPAVFFCHGWLPWEEAPLRHPAIRRYVAVSGATRERLVAEHAVPSVLVRTIPNFVDTRRFHPRAPIPPSPRRALVFSNQAVEGGWVATLRQVCAERGIAVEVAGLRSGRSLPCPEQALGDYDLVFARGRSALEAMAVGCAVILCDAEGLGPMVSPENLDHLGNGNFGVQVLTDAHRPELMRRAIDAYDADAAGRVSALVRDTRALERVLPRVFAVYEEALADHAAAPHDTAEAVTAQGAYLSWLHREFPEPWFAQREAHARILVDVDARHRDLSAECEHLRQVVDAERLAGDAARHALARVESEREALAASHQAALEATTRVAEAERETAARLDSERGDHAATLAAAAAHAARLQAEVERLAADAAAVSATLSQVRGGFLFRRVLTPLWKARLRGLPDGSAGYRAYRRLRTTTGRLVGLVPPPPPATVALAEVATAVPPGARIAAIVMDVGGRPETVDAVASLLAQTPAPEVVVVSSGGGDLDRQIAQAGHDVTVVQVSRRLMPGGTRNVGLAASEAPWVGFLAGDSLAQPGWAAGRLAAHTAGAEAVSSAVVNHTRWNPFAAAAHCLLLAYRLPGVSRSRQLHYGASFARTLFARFGTFRHDLRTGEDTELRERFQGRVRFAFRGDVRVAHRNPTSLLGLLRDQFHRGRRTVRAREELYAAPARALVARVALTRVPRSLWISLASSPLRDWGPILWGLPWLVPGALAYAAGAATAPRRTGAAESPRDVEHATSARPSHNGRIRLICVTPFRNERRYLADFLANVAPQVDGIVALDDGSSDGSGEHRRGSLGGAGGDSCRAAPAAPLERAAEPPPAGGRGRAAWRGLGDRARCGRTARTRLPGANGSDRRAGGRGGATGVRRDVPRDVGRPGSVPHGRRVGPQAERAPVPRPPRSRLRVAGAARALGAGEQPRRGRRLRARRPDRLSPADDRGRRSRAAHAPLPGARPRSAVATHRVRVPRGSGRARARDVTAGTRVRAAGAGGHRGAGRAPGAGGRGRAARALGERGVRR
jgi:glycosyltransferase involved in cell wall biosynthesis